MFDRPTNNVWPNLYDFYWNSIIPLSLSLYGLSIGLVIFLESTSHLFSSFHTSKLKKRAFSGLLGILSWWWIAAISLRFVDALTGVLAPSLSEVTLFETVSFSAMGILGTVLALSADLTLFLLLALVYLVRQVVLYMFVLLMPVLIVFWIPGVGPLALVSRFVQRLAGFFTPFLLMTIPVAILFRVGQLLGHSFGPSMGGIGAWLTALVIPLLAVFAPIVMIWQAGSIFRAGNRISWQVSSQRSQARIGRAREASRSTVREAAHGGRNFARGTRGRQAVREDGQAVFESGDSRAHASGERLNAAGRSLRSSLRSDGGTDSATDDEISDYWMASRPAVEDSLLDDDDDSDAS